MIRQYEISDLEGLISWDYLFFAWGLNKAGKPEKDSLRRDAETMLRKWEGLYKTFSLTKQCAANSAGDDIIIGGTVFPMLRQQTGQFLCLADYVKPAVLGADKIGLFATTTSKDIEELSSADPYERMLAQTLADRLAEATAEMVSKKMPGIRPAPGYPSMPDTSINFLIDRVLGLNRIGISLTETGMMVPHASVSGLIFFHPEAKYFSLTHVGEDQLADYARRRGFTTDEMRK